MLVFLSIFHHREFISPPALLSSLFLFSINYVFKVSPSMSLVKFLTDFRIHILALSSIKGYLFSMCMPHKCNLDSSGDYTFPPLLKKYVDQYYYYAQSRI